jgi:hypothetical protein
MNHFTEFFFAKHHGEYFEMSVENIRAEIRESRDLKQDLQDIQDGIAVVHASDYEKQEQEKKKELRQERKNKNKDKLLKALTELGEDGIDTLTEKRIEKALRVGDMTAEEYYAALDKFIHKSEQLSLFE